MTPSPGLDASADYLADQFRGAGLAPGATGSYFQKASFAQITPRPDDFRMTVEVGARRSSVSTNNARIESLVALDFKDEQIVRLPQKGPILNIAGRVVSVGEEYAKPNALYLLETRNPALILLTLSGEKHSGSSPTLLEADPAIPPVIRIYSRGAAALLSGKEDARLTLHSEAPLRHDVTLRNVAGIIRGSEPAVRDQYVIVSAHYDHLGMRTPGPGDRVYNGANDNASGVASLIEIAKALDHPRRSVLFLALFGEEEGLMGSHYYVRHPLVPIAKTVADVNLEQLGRTDSSDGPEIARFAFSGPTYSNLPATMAAAAKAEGTAVYKKDNADEYFDRSDNYEFALTGIVAHTVVVAFEFPDYHEVGDEAGKIDYGNLARVDRGIAAGVEAVANAAEAPKWSDTKAASMYRDAR
jgi:Peptidase family M28